MASRDWLDKDFYRILGVSKEASKEDIKRAYRKLAQKHHPDANKEDPEAERRFKEISEAYSILSNDDKRKEYDELRRYAEAGGGGDPFGFRPGGGRVRVNVGNAGDLFGDGDVGDLFEEVFGFGTRRVRRGADVETEARLTFDEAVNGTTFELANGTKVRVRPGVHDGARIKVPRKGRPGPDGGEPGDLFVRVRVEPHPVFNQGSGSDLIVHLPITLAEASLGTRVQVPTLDGAVTVKIPAGTRPGKRLRLKGKGAPRPGGGHGDLMVIVDLEVPQKLSKKEKELLEEFARIDDSSPRAHLEELIERKSRSHQAAS